MALLFRTSPPHTHTRARAHTQKHTHAPHPPLQIKIEDGEEAYLENQIGKLATDTQGQPIPYVVHRAFALPAHFDTEAPVTRSALQSLSGATRTFGGLASSASLPRERWPSWS